jgi:hypothetical protein
MRMMLRFTVPVEKGNAALKDGSLGKAMESIMGQLKPEAAYFGVSDGLRGGMIFFDMTEASQVVEIVEPFFLAFDAAVELIPVMTGDDLRKGLAKAKPK